MINKSNLNAVLIRCPTKIKIGKVKEINFLQHCKYKTNWPLLKCKISSSNRPSWKCLLNHKIPVVCCFTELKLIMFLSSRAKILLHPKNRSTSKEQTHAVLTLVAIGHYRNVRGLGKSMVVFRLFENQDIQMKDQLYFSLYHE